MIELTMPKLSDSMQQGTILTWLKADGGYVAAGDDLLEIETDKATVTHATDVGGTLQIMAPEGTTVAVGAPIARLGSAGEATPPIPAAAVNGKESVLDTAPHSDNAAPRGSDATVRATPLARRAAAIHGISLETVAGSGPLGRITRTDVITQAGIAPAPTARPVAQAAEATRPAPRHPVPPAETDKGTTEMVEPTTTQSLIARRMAEAKATVPHFQVQTEVMIDDALALRAQCKASGADPPSLNDLMIKAAALALRDCPRANGSYRNHRFELHSRINIGVAVAVAAKNALLVPTIHDADQKSLGSIAAETRRLAQRVREGTIAAAELSGATFTVSNLGMHGMTAIFPVIDPPQAAILGVGATRDTLGRVDGEIVDRRLITLTLSCDHRILYGADAADLMSRIRKLLEEPIRLFL